MILLLGSIFFASLLTFIFKIFPRYGVDTFSAIIVNYLVCYICGRGLMGAIPLKQAFGSDWWVYAAVLSIFFISGFWFVATTVQRFGIGMATLMQKMSLVISVTFVIIAYAESTHLVKIAGLFLAVTSIGLYNRNAFRTDSRFGKLWIYPVMAWVISGIIEIVLFLAQARGTIQDEDASFVSVIFFGAGTLGLAVAIMGNKWRALFEMKNIFAGMALGIPNFFSMYLLVKLLNIGWEGSIVFPINNIGTLVLSSIGALLIFNERHDIFKWTGLTLAVLSIILLSMFTS